MKEILLYFITGGSITVLIVLLEQSGHRILSGFAALVPVFTLVSYLFIGNTEGGNAVAKHSMFVLVGTLISWVPYMLVISYLAPKIGPNRAIVFGMAVFFILAGGFVYIVAKLNLFK